MIGRVTCDLVYKGLVEIKSVLCATKVGESFLFLVKVKPLEPKDIVTPSLT